MRTQCEVVIMYGPGGKEHVDGPVFNIDDYTQYKAMQLSKNAYK